MMPAGPTLGGCRHAADRCLPCLTATLEGQLRLRRALTTPTGDLASLGQTRGGPFAWAVTIDAKIAQLVVELVLGVPADSIVWGMIGRMAEDRNN